MRSTDVMTTLARVRGDAPVISGPSIAALALGRHHPTPPTIYAMDLAYATPMCVGVALARSDQRVIAVEGDGSLLAGCPALVTIARIRPPNLIVLAHDNGVYATVGDDCVDTGTRHGASLAALGRACGLPADLVLEPAGVDDLEVALHTALHRPGPWMVVVKVDRDPFDPAAMPSARDIDVVEAAIQFRTQLRSTRAARSSGSSG